MPKEMTDDQVRKAIIALRKQMPGHSLLMGVCCWADEKLNRRRFRSLDSISARKPWEADGMSRRSWYRRRAMERELGDRLKTPSIKGDFE